MPKVIDVIVNYLWTEERNLCNPIKIVLLFKIEQELFHVAAHRIYVCLYIDQLIIWIN